MPRYICNFGIVIIRSVLNTLVELRYWVTSVIGSRRNYSHVGSAPNNFRSAHTFRSGCQFPRLKKQSQQY